MDDLFALNTRKLGFGLMRLPKDENGNIDEAETARMADRFIEKEFTYFDTAYVYPGSEEIFRKSIGSRHPRDSYTLASKMSGWALSEEKTPEKMFEEQLKRTGLDYFDFYLLHSLKKENLPTYDKYDAWSYCAKLKRDGKIRHLGFSFHDNPELLDKILTEHPEMEFVQLQINYLDWTSPSIKSEGIYSVARKHKKPIIIMEPVKGGLLANLVPEITQPFGAKSPASYALRYAAGLDGVLAVLSGMSTMDQLEENVMIFSPFEKLSRSEEEAVQTVKRKIEEMQVIQCTSCKYCVPGCPKKIPIPDIFKHMNEAAVLSDRTRPKESYAALVSNGQSGQAADCIRCGKSEKTCPQKLPIRELLAKAESVLC